MQYKCLKCEGYTLAILGAMLSKGVTDFEVLNKASENLPSPDLMRRADVLATKLSGADGGHNKFLEQIQYWLLIQAPLYFWKQFDTYRVGISKSSESTMFRMWKQGVSQENFESKVYKETLTNLNKEIKEYNKEPSDEKFKSIVNNLPDGYLQTRLVNANAKALRNIYQQRKAHKLVEWRNFCKFIKGLPYGSLITKERE